MKPSLILSFLYLTLLVSSALIPYSPQTPALSLADNSNGDEFPKLGKRMDGGGGRGGGGRGRGGGSYGRPPSSYSFSTTQNTGGLTISGSGLKPAYNGRYAGGATVPYTSGQRSPTRGLLPLALPITAFAFFPGLWLYGTLYTYPYHLPYFWISDGRNQTANITCLCQRYSECGCDDNVNNTFLEDLINNGTGHPVNTSTVRCIPLPDGKHSVYINGTLPNGTTAAGGTAPSNAGEISEAAKRRAICLVVMAVATGVVVLFIVC